MRNNKKNRENGRSREPEAQKEWDSVNELHHRNLALLYTVTIIVFLVLVLISWVTNRFSFGDFISNIIGNLIGAIPPLLLFDIFYSRISENQSEIETTRRLTEAMLTSPRTIAAFSSERRRQFMDSSIRSYTDDPDVSGMIEERIMDYIDAIDNPDAASTGSVSRSGRAFTALRTKFEYHLRVTPCTAPQSSGAEHPFRLVENPEQYYDVFEDLKYKISYLPSANRGIIDNRFYIGFPFGIENLDEVFRGFHPDRMDPDAADNIIFRESIDLTLSDAQRLLKRIQDNNDSSDRENRRRADGESFLHSIGLTVKIDNEVARPRNVTVPEEENGTIKGIYVEYELQNFQKDLQKHDVHITCHVPKKWEAPVEVALVDPTKAPTISLSYATDATDVHMYAFLSQSRESSVAMAREPINGIYDVSIDNEWIYPVSGIVFTVDRREKVS